MPFYNVAENGSLRKVTKLHFSDNNRVYLIDTDNIIYLWYGEKASKKKKNLGLNRAKQLKEKKEISAKVQIIQQNQEFGGFLAIMEAYKANGAIDGNIKLRPELELEVEDTKELIEAGLEPDLIAEINIAAYELTQKNKEYKELCTELAKLQLSIIKGKGKKITENEIKRKSEVILKSSATYEEVCWLISELSILSNKKIFKKH
ncbi:MAG: hypothetical protein ACFFBH_04465 [Promethearchaeota archaeon]